MGRNQFIKGVLDQRRVYEQQPEAGTRVRSTVLPSAGATPRLKGSGSGVKEQTKPGEKKVNAIFPRLLQLLITSVMPTKGKAALWVQAAPFTLRHCPQLRQCCAGWEQEKEQNHHDVAADQGSVVSYSSDTGPAQTGVTHLIFLHITSREI